MIQYLEVTITPYYTTGHPHQNVKVEIKELGKRPQYLQMAIPVDDFISHFEQFMDEAKTMVLKRLKENTELEDHVKQFIGE